MAAQLQRASRAARLRARRRAQRRKLLASVLMLIALATVGVHTWSSFSAAAVNPGNTFAAGSVTLSDAAGPNPGTYSGGPTLGRPAGVRNGGTAVGFDGSNDKVTAGDVYDFTGLVPMSVEAWVNRTTFNESSFRRIVTKDWNVDSANRGGWALKLESGTNVFGFTRYDNTPTSTITSTTVTQPGIWYHVVVTFDGSSQRMYVNGALEATTSTSVALPDHAYPLTLGQQADSGSSFQGDIDEVAIWTRALSAGEVKAHYEAGR